MAIERDGSPRRVMGAGCPVCGKPVDAAAAPFCSARCADVDLGRWFTERYAVPGPDAETPADDPDG